MPRFFVDKTQISDHTVVLTGDDAYHVSRSLRMAPGEEIIVSDGEGTDYRAVLTRFTENTAEASVLSSAPSQNEPPVYIRLYQGYPKGDKLETVIQKAVELGASEIVPFISSRCVKRPAEEKTEKILLRQNRIAHEAAKQCGRGRLPQVRACLSFAEMLKQATADATAFFCYEDEQALSLKAALQALPSSVRKISVIVGSEGGFSPEEAADAREAGAVSVGLGHRILRCETAPTVAFPAVMYACEW